MTKSVKSKDEADISHPMPPPHLVKLQYSLRRAFQLLITGGDPETALFELPVGQFRCLRRIMDQDGCKLVDLARETNLSLPNASRLVDRLVQRGLVTRLTDPRDRRAIRLHATSEAIEMIDAITMKRLEHLEKATKDLSFEEVEDSIKQLHVLIDAAEKSAASRQAAAKK
jgi:DNA-binding MarR family transcriptional regulator